MDSNIPITVEFEIEEQPTIEFEIEEQPTIAFEIEEPITVEFRVYYKKGKKWKKFLGEGYTGDRMANELL